jgi:hypothetical protein
MDIQNMQDCIRKCSLSKEPKEYWIQVNHGKPSMFVWAELVQLETVIHVSAVRTFYYSTVAEKSISQPLVEIGEN